ncbi:MAG: diguanylate cyclase [Nitrospirae bacterium]|nr:diguanylate cyclase [Nitrospirota bacterium]MBF0534934.1 diguanylate cyclase [Nitrospirota bacterium]MBF0617215.1 diguanylate cyclase [Nitrospirota bacterium]
MGLFSKKRDDDCGEATVESLAEKNEELAEKLTCLGEQKRFLIQAVKTLLVFLKDFSFDIKEIDSDKFKGKMDALSEDVSKEEKVKRLQSVFEKSKETIISFIESKKIYFKERESEYKTIIDLLSKGISALETGNMDFNRRVYERSEKIGKITLLDDIKKIKEEIRNEVEHIQDAIRQKETADSKQLDELTREVSALREDLMKARTDSLLDGLTGVYNRMAYESYMRKLMDANTVNGIGFSMLMIDIDNFKSINDTYGHQTGDRALVAMVQVCREHIRKEDFFARYGGEEFVVILPDTSLKNAAKRATAICKSVESSRYKLDGAFEGKALSFTVSVGVSIFRDGEKSDATTERADRALYMAKNTGKNRVVTENELK